MERKRVRIYKAPDGQGEYRSKLKSFIKAQEGMSVDDSQMRRTQQDALKDNAINTYIKHINEQLKDGMSVQTIYKDLIDKGLAEEEAAGVLKYFIENNLENSTDDTEESGEQEQPAMQEGGVPEEVLGEYDAVKGGGSEDEEDGIDITKLLKEPAENYLSDLQSNSKLYFPSLSDYVYDYKPIQWIDTNQNSVYGGLEQSKKGGVAKKNFVKNVLKHFQEGGDEPANQGDKMDTITSDISNKKKAFIAKLKQVNEEEKLKNLYDQMMETNDPDLMQTAQTIAGGNDGAGVDNEESLAQQQYGGYSGEGQPELFMYGGIDFPYDLEQAQDGKEVRKTKVKYTPNPTLPSSKLRLFNPAWGERKIYTNRPYNALTRELYRDPVDDLTPVARTVHKRGIFGRPKKWTDYYQKGPSNIDQDFINNFSEYKPKADTDKTKNKKDTGFNKWGYPEEVWDELSGKARRAIKRGERRLNRRKGYEDEKELTIQELIALQEEQRKKENDKAYKERKDAIEKDNKRLEEEKKLERVNDPDRKKADWETVNDRINNKLEQYTKEQLEKFDKESEKPKKPGLLEAIKAESDKISSQQLVDQMYNSAYPNSPLLLHNSNEEDFLENWYLPKIEQSEEFQPSSEMMEPGLNDYYKFGYGKSKATLAEEEEAEREAQEAEEANEFEQDMIRGKRGFSYGGILHKAQIGVKTPTNGLSSASDPTANSGNLINFLKPQDNDNTFMGASSTFMNQNVPTNTEAGKVETIEMDPNQTKDQTITSLDFGNPDNDKETIAQDFESKRDFNGEAFNNKLNAGIDLFTGAAKALDKNKQMAEYYQNNIGVDAFMNPQIAKSKGKFVAYGQENGLIDPTKMGNERNSIFAGTDSAQSGGYMQDGGQSREEILKQFTGTPEFKKGLDLMMQRENTDNTDPFFDAMRDANYYGQKGLSVSHRDSVAHQADKILKYEQLRGAEDGSGLSYYKDPKYKKILMDEMYPKVSKIAPNASAIEKGEMMDFMFNSGKDPRVFAYQEYLRKTDPQNKTNWMDKDGKWKDRKSVDEQTMNDLYSKSIGKLPENDRRKYTNLGRDWYYKNTAPKGSQYGDWDLKTQGSHPAYGNTWYGRIWNTNDYNEFDAKNPKFTPKKEYGGHMEYGGYIEEGEYAEGGIFDMDEDELREFLANGGEVEYLES